MRIRITLMGVLALSFAGCGSETLNSIDPGGGASTATVVALRKENGATENGIDVQKTGVEVAIQGGGDPASVLGRIVLDGTAPQLPALFSKGGAKADPTVCAKDSAIPDESLVLGGGGEIANVFIYLDKAPAGAPTVESKDNSLLDQVACVFKPHALFVQTGKPFPLKNSDPVPHNVQTTPQKNAAENNNMNPGSTMELKFKKPEKQPFESKCAIHAWMKFYTLVLDHPYATVTDTTGKFEIPNLPAGEHQLRIWHERAGMISQKVKIAGGKPTDLGDIKIPVAKMGFK